jgi:hypothetical protein
LLSLLLRSELCPEILGSHLSRETGYRNWNFWWLFSVPPGNARTVPRSGHGRSLINPFQFIIHQPTYCSILWMYWQSRSVIYGTKIT